MIASLSGLVKQASLNSAIIEVGGVGILVNLPARFAATLLVGTSAQIYTSLVVREDSLTLFGFESSEGKDFFELLQTVSGIGPKVAQSALSIYEPREIADAISSGNTAALERIPGLGKKGAARVLLELKEKVVGLSTSKASGQASAGWRIQVQSALISLGYVSRDVDSLLEELVSSEGSKLDSMTLSQILKLALQVSGSK
jgi:Holliday junction DNA helicase RuvA